MKKTKNEELGRLDVAAFKEAEKQNIVVILDNVRSGMNVGSAFRSADAFRIQAIALCGITAQPPHREILKTALGSTATVDWAHFSKTEEAVEHWRAKGYTICSVEQAEPKVWLQDVPFKKGDKIALVFGNEVTGVSEAVIKMSDAVIEIPQFGTKHSLNISVSMGVVLWELTRKSL